MGGWWRWALVSPGGVAVAPSRMVSVSASVNLPLHHSRMPCTIKARRSLLAPAYPGGPGKRAVKRMCVSVCVTIHINVHIEYGTCMSNSGATALTL